MFAMLRLVGSVISPRKGISFADIWHPWVSAGSSPSVPASWKRFGQKDAFVYAATQLYGAWGEKAGLKPVKVNAFKLFNAGGASEILFMSMQTRALVPILTPEESLAKGCSLHRNGRCAIPEVK